MRRIFQTFSLILLFRSLDGTPSLFDWLEDPEPVEVNDIRNDAITIVWHLPEETANLTTKQRLMVNVIKTSTVSARHSMSLYLDGTDRTYTFQGLVGNTTYRVSVEAFKDDVSLWYGSNIATTSLAALNWLPPPSEFQLLDKTNDSLEVSWVTPDTSNTGHHVIINQYSINVYEFVPQSKLFTKKASFNVPIPRTSFIITKLTPSSVYNVTIQAGTTYGYGNTAWSSFSTLANNSTFVLRQKLKTPNALTLVWPANWMSTQAKFKVRAKTLHSQDGVEKEIQNTGYIEHGKPHEYVLRDLHPGSTYNVSITTAADPEKARGKWVNPVQMKTVWSVFSTLVQGEYVVSEGRIVVETETSASIVFSPLQVHGYITYQIRYFVHDDHSELKTTEELHDEDLRCPKFGCEWKCFLVFNLARRPRDYAFEIRAKVDGMWNKWSQIQRRPWNLLERVCSINPPSVHVENIGETDFQRLLDLRSAKLNSQEDAWRYLVVVDSRYSDIASIDITKLADKATADFDHIPYYISGSLTPDEVKRNIDFRIGDGKVYGGYLNYPLKDRSTDPQWTLIPMGQQENEIMEPRLKTCGFTEQGFFECDMSFSEVFSYIPNWVKVMSAILFCLLVLLMCMLGICCCRQCRCCAKKSKTEESSMLYYHNDSPHHSLVTREYRRVEQREFGPDEDDERREFMEYLE